MIHFSCADYTFPLLSRSQRFALLKLLGFTHVDIGLFERSTDMTPSRMLAAPKAFIKQLQIDLKDADLQVADVFLQTGLDPSVSAANDSSLPVRAHNRRIFSLTLDLCAALACKHITGLPGVWHEGSNKTVDFELAVESAAWRQRAAADASVNYAIEAHVGSICSDIPSTHALLDAVPGLTLTLDYGHFIVARIPSSKVHPLLRFASHIHARCGAPDRLQTSLSENRIDFGGMVSRMSKQKYTGYVAIEYVHVDWQQCNRTDNVSETILLRRLLEDCENSAQNPAQTSPGDEYV